MYPFRTCLAIPWSERFPTTTIKIFPQQSSTTYKVVSKLMPIMSLAQKVLHSPATRKRSSHACPHMHLHQLFRQPSSSFLNRCLPSCKPIAPCSKFKVKPCVSIHPSAKVFLQTNPISSSSIPDTSSPFHSSNFPP